jgi:two-component system KDP operon response regulator KdpE
MEELCKNPGTVVTHRDLITSIWGVCLNEDSKILRVNIRNIRRKLKENATRPQYIFTEMGIGYRVAEETVS